jgi:aspartyl-tRNA(Asn)/glutamyl-tRNA(Gln) amidotransferase subunit A
MEPFLTVRSLKEKLDKKEVSPEEVLAYYNARFKQYDGELKSALEIFDAASVLASSNSRGALYGIPGLIKDNINQENRRLTCASRILEHFVSPYDATATARLKDKGALLIGRANMDEFAMGSSTETSAFAKTKNPWDITRVPGGSSGGSAVAVAAGLVPWALGSETGGSVRQPAAFCGIVGFKPTYGLISRYGLVAYGSSLDQIGIFAHTAYDVAMICSVIAGKDSMDSTSLPVEQKDYTQDLTGSLPKGLTIGVVDNALYAEGMDAEVIQAIEQTIAQYEKLGATIKRVKLPILDYAAAAYFILSRAEAASNLARFDGVRYGSRAQSNSLKEMYARTRHDGFGQEVRARIMVGNYVLSAGHAAAYYESAKKVQGLIRRDIAQAFADVDMLIMPTHPAPAFKFGAYNDNKLQMDLQDYFTCAMNISGNPAISIPCGLSSEGLPIGVQLVGPHLSETMLFQVADAYQSVTDWHTKHPQELRS